MSHNKYQPAPEGKDPLLWEIARKRASFKSHLMAYIIVNAFLWALWFFARPYYDSFYTERLPWPAWPMLGWGIGLAFHFVNAYVFPENNLVEKEYEKLQQQKQHTPKSL
jgi:hypothetical protein